jgi:beta-lactamase class D
MPMAETMFAVAMAVADEAAKAVPVANRARTRERVVTVSFFKIDSSGSAVSSEG